MQEARCNFDGFCNNAYATCNRKEEKIALMQFS